MTTLARQLRLADRVTLVGDQRDMWRFYAALDVFVLPSRWEAMPYALLEAMAARVPTVVSDFLGGEELVTHGESGMVFPRGDSCAMPESILRLLREKAFSHCIAHRAWEWVSRKHDALRQVERLQIVYEQCLREKRH